MGLEYAEFLRIRVVHAEAALARCLEHVRITRSKAQEYIYMFFHLQIAIELLLLCSQLMIEATANKRMHVVVDTYPIHDMHIIEH